MQSMLSFTVIGLAELTPGKDDGRERWGAVKGLLNAVAGERLESLQLTVHAVGASSTGAPVEVQIFSSEQAAWSPSEEVLHFASQFPVPPPRPSGDSTLTIRIWRCVGRARAMAGAQSSDAPRGQRTMLATAQLSQQDIESNLPAPGNGPYSRQLSSERYPAAELLLWSSPDVLEAALTLGPRAACNPTVSRFNPMTHAFTLLHPSALPGGGGSGGGGGGGGGGGAHFGNLALKSQDSGLILCREVAAEARHALQLPLQFLHPMHAALKTADRAWRQRLELERRRQGRFRDAAAAFEMGQIMVRVSVLEAKGLEAIAPPETAPALPLVPAGGSPGSANAAGGSSAMNGEGFGSNNNGSSGSLDALGGSNNSGSSGGGGAGKSLKLADMRRLGGKAVAIAKNATQANVARLQNATSAAAGGGGGGGSSRTSSFRTGGGGGNALDSSGSSARTPRQAHYFARVSYNPNGSPAGLTRQIGRTNTEYATFSPVFGSNAGRMSCPHTKPRTRHGVAGAAALEDLPGPSNGAKAPPQMRFFCPASEASSEATLTVTLCQEGYSIARGIGEANLAVASLKLSDVLASGQASVAAWLPLLGYEQYNTSGGGSGSDAFAAAASSAGTPPMVLVQLSLSTFYDPSDPAAGAPLPNGGATSPSGNASSGNVLGTSSDKSASSSAAALAWGGYGAAASAGDDSDDDDGEEEAEVTPQRLGMAGATSSPPVSPPRAGSGFGGGSPARKDFFGGGGASANGEGEGAALQIADCYAWLSLVPSALGAEAAPPPPPPPQVVADAVALDGLALQGTWDEAFYSISWIERHIAALAAVRQRLAAAMDVCAGGLAAGTAFRSSAHKKDRNLQFAAINLHNQVCSAGVLTAGGENGAVVNTVHFDFVTTGAPAAHALGFGPSKASGLVTLENELALSAANVTSVRRRLAELRARNASAAAAGEAAAALAAAVAAEATSEELRAALLAWEERATVAAVRRTVVCAQVLGIAAACVAGRLEMLGLGTLDAVGANLPCADALAARWAAHGFLIGFEGLLSVQGKELGMVEDTVAAMRLLEQYSVLIVPAEEEENGEMSGSGVITNAAAAAAAAAAPSAAAAAAAFDPWGAPGTFLNGNNNNPSGNVTAAVETAVKKNSTVELDVSVRGRHLRVTVGPDLLAALPPQMVGLPLPLVPVFFTQGIDIQQSVSHASGTSKAAFQARVNAASFAKLNRYCHAVNKTTTSFSNSKSSNSSTYSSADAATGVTFGGGGANSGGFIGSARDDSGSGGGVVDLLDFSSLDVSSEPPPVQTTKSGQNNNRSGLLAGAPPLPPKPASLAASPPPPPPAVAAAQAAAALAATHPALRELERAVMAQQLNAKNTTVLLAGAAAVRMLGGARVTFCKSGKDRTAMAVTLEEAALVRQRFGVAFGGSGSGGGGSSSVSAEAAAMDGLPLANVLRAHGVRMAIAEKNVGRPKYSFNAIQRGFLPELYRAPPQTINDVITSAINRDS